LKLVVATKDVQRPAAGKTQIVLLFSRALLIMAGSDFDIGATLRMRLQEITQKKAAIGVSRFHRDWIGSSNAVQQRSGAPFFDCTVHCSHTIQFHSIPCPQSIKTMQ
jgi:hypothetical protein